jgi:hypothetical protein
MFNQPFRKISQNLFSFVHDSFAMVYDIRKEPLNFIADYKDLPSCVQYYCPEHLSKSANPSQVS